MSFLEVQFEDEVRRNPYSVRTWWNYAHSKVDEASPLDRFTVYERALAYLPRSFKLWHAYLDDRTAHMKRHSIKSKKYDLLIDTFERALVFMNKMPRIWLDYCQLMMHLRKGTAARRVFDRALEALPITQHTEVWTLYVDWATQFNVPETAIRVYRRYLMFDPGYREDYVNYLLEIGQHAEAARQLVTILNDPTFVSPSGNTQHTLWMQLCDICCKHPEEVVNTIKVEELIRSGISRFSDEIARLWTSLADYYIRLGQLERARDVYEEALASVSTVRDFTVIYDTYIKVEESILTAKMKYMNDDELTSDEQAEEMNEVNLRLARLEYLLEQRPLLLNSVALRQNPHSVKDWCKRVRLLKDEAVTLLTIAEAVQTIHPKQAMGRLSGLYKIWATIYEQKGDLINARAVYERGIYINYKSTEESADLWCAYADMEVRAEQYPLALDILSRAVQDPAVHSKKRIFSDDNTGHHAIDRLYKSTKVWAAYLDLEESLGSLQKVRDAYERCMELKVITPLMLLNYASYLEDASYFEESFTVYERGLELFIFPAVKAVYAVYIDKFVARYAGSKLERLRDLFETLLTKVPAADAAEYFIKYAKLEESYGLGRHVLLIYERAVAAVPDKQRLDMYRLYAKKVEQLCGLIKTRAVYEQALQKLSDADCKAFVLEYAAMERKLNEIDRARAIYVYGAQFADPRREADYYLTWREFEEAHGNEETFREMLRVQRSVQVTFSQVNYLASEMVAASATPAPSAVGMATSMDMMAQQAEASAVEAAGKRKFVSASSNQQQEQAEQPPSKIARNDEEIDI